MKSVLSKAAGLLLTLIVISVAAFGILRVIPGDPVLNLLGERGGSPAVIEDLRARLGLNLSLHEQYFIFVKNALQGDLGESLQSRRSVFGEFIERFAATLELGTVALIFAIGLGVPIGIIAAVKRGTILDYGLMGTSLIGYSMPIFWWGLMLIILFSVQLGLTPVSGRVGIEFDIPRWSGFLLVDSLRTENPVPALYSVLRHLILPGIVLGTVPLATIARMTRSSLLEVLGEDYIRTSRAMGVGEFRVVVVHALRNAMIPIVTIIGLMAGTIMTGAVLTETIFSWPGVGLWMVQSVLARDYPVIQAGLLLIASIVMIINLSVDLIYLWVNPRLRAGGS